MSTAAIEVELAGANAGGRAVDQGEPIALAPSLPPLDAAQASNHAALPLLEQQQQQQEHEYGRGAGLAPQSSSSSDALPSPSASRRKSTALNAATANRRTSVSGAADLTAFQRDMLSDSPGLGWLTALCCCRENAVHPRLFDLGTVQLVVSTLLRPQAGGCRLSPCAFSRTTYLTCKQHNCHNITDKLLLLFIFYVLRNHQSAITLRASGAP